MFDTVRARIIGRLTYDTDQAIMDGLKGFSVLHRTYEQRKEQWMGPMDGKVAFHDTRSSVMFHHEETGLRIMGYRMEDYPEKGKSSAVVDCMEMSLPRQIFPTNGQLITTDAQVDDAIRHAYDLSSALVPDIRLEHFTRLDLAYNFAVDPYPLLSQLSRIRHPKIRKHTTEYNIGESINFRGKERKFKAYDKRLEQVGKKGTITRMEVELRGAALVKDFDHAKSPRTDRQLFLPDVVREQAPVGESSVRREGLSSPDLEMNTVIGGKVRSLPPVATTYKVFREFVLGFEPATIPTPSRLLDLMAKCLMKSAKFEDGTSVFDEYMESLRPQSRPRALREAKRRIRQYKDITLRQLLPPDTLPEPHNVTETKECFSEKPS